MLVLQKSFDSLTHLDLFNNDICNSDEYRTKVFKLLPNLKYLDDADADDNDEAEEESNVEKEVLNFPQPCPQCFREGIVKMYQATIPFFKAIIIMAFVCEICGYKSTEIKQGGGISEKGPTCPTPAFKNSIAIS